MNGEVPSDPGPDPILALAILDTVIDPDAAALALAVREHQRRHVVGRECCCCSDETCSCSLHGAVPPDPGPVPILVLAIDPAAAAALALAGYVVGCECCYFSDETCSCSWNGEVPSDPCPVPILALTVLDTVVDPAAPAATTARDSDSSHYSPPLLHASLTWTNSSFQATHSQ